MAYPGSKASAGVFQRIINLFPPHQVYIEPFYGAGAVMKAKRPASVNIGLDRSRAAVERASSDLMLSAAGAGWRARVCRGDKVYTGILERVETGEGGSTLRLVKSGDARGYVFRFRKGPNHSLSSGASAFVVASRMSLKTL